MSSFGLKALSFKVYMGHGSVSHVDVLTIPLVRTRSEPYTAIDQGSVFLASYLVSKLTGE